MPRIAEVRQPAEPSSPEQKDRYRRILRAAARQGAAKGLERMQMHDVAKDAGVAIATLYRYFPSKTHLFTALLTARIERLSELIAELPPSQDPVEAASDMLIEASRQLLANPLLAHAMVQSNNAAVLSGNGQTKSFSDLLLETMRLADPTEEEYSLVRIVEAAWYGILISALNRHITEEQAELDTRLACQRLLGGIPSR